MREAPISPPIKNAQKRLPGGAEFHGARHSDGEIRDLREDREDQQGDEDLGPDPLKPRDGCIDERIDEDDGGSRKAEKYGEGAEQKHQDEDGQSSNLQGRQIISSSSVRSV